MQLFYNIPRNNNDPMQRMEGYYTFLNRSGMPQSLKMREVLEQWFSEYPQDEQLELKRRFEINDESAFFELFLHSLLIRLGCEVTVHPSKEGANEKKPDFFVIPPDGNDFFMEAVVVSEGSEEQQKARKRIDYVYDLLDQIDIPGYMFSIEQNGTPKTQPSKNDIKHFIEEQLKQTSRLEIQNSWLSGDYKRLVKWKYRFEDWTPTIIPIPVDTDGERIQRSIGITSQPLGEFVNLKKSIIKKARKYGKFNLPYIIAVNAINGSIHDNEVMESLYGSTQCHIKRDKSGFPYEPEIIRVPDGVWTSRNGPVYTRVSAVLLAKELRTDKISRADIKLYHNPWAQKPYNSVLNNLTQFILKDNYLKEIQGRSLGNILDLPLSWPDI